MYLGVDGGGSKTALILLDREGEVRATHLTSGSYYLSVGLEALGALLGTAIGELLRKAQIEARAVDFAFLGLPAYGEDRMATAVMDHLPAGALRPGAFLCGNDMICGWAGSLVCRDGINVVAGTGSICYGERHGVAARCGGWGEMFSDEGSAYWIACRGLDLFARMSDGRLAQGPLYHLMRERLQLSADLELCGHVYATLGSDRARIAQLCPLIFEAAAMGDAPAAGVIAQAGEELASLVDATRVRLAFGANETVEVSYSGGVFEGAASALRQRFSLALAARGAFRLCEPVFPPVIGAALYAAKRHGQPLAAAALERLRARAAEVQKEMRA